MTVITCICGEQEKWQIRHGEIKCMKCGKRYQFNKIFLSPSYFNDFKDRVLIQENEMPNL